MDVLSSYQSNAAETPLVRKVLLWSLVASLVLHALTLAFFGVTKLPNFTEVSTDRLVPRAFSIRQIQIDPKLLEETQETPVEQIKKDTTELKKVELPPETKTPDQDLNEIRATPMPVEVVTPIISHKLDTESAPPEMAKIEAESSQTMDKEMDAVRDKLLNDKAGAANNSLLKFSDSGDMANKHSTGAGAGMPGFSDLDSLLGGQGLKEGTAPILMPTDLLFDEDQSELRPGAVVSLQKLGKLIQRNPQATFGIEGHTDSIGTPEYNQVLSERRAESVKAWLVQTMDIDPEKIQTRGYGSTRLLAPATGDVEKEQLNRRVEIVIKIKK